jgi:hypothetical protein
MFNATLSIDLGASYTKIAYRKNCNLKGVGRIVEHAKTLVLQGSPLIPSLALRASGGKQQWFFGKTAAAMNPGGRMQVYMNWKSNLFRPSNDEASATGILVAGQFFRWLRDELQGGIDLSTAETRVAMPAFSNIDAKALVIAKCMELNGWDSPRILKATEPHANVLGLFSGGFNALGRNSKGDVLLNYGKMFGPGSGYIKKSRSFSLRAPRVGASSIYRVMVVDIGAFTTDLASLEFDVDSCQDGLQRINQNSYAIGVINQLDLPVFTSLEQRHGFSMKEISFDDSEVMKRRLYGGGSHSLLTTGKRNFIVGGKKDEDLISEHIENFAAQIWKQLQGHIQRSDPSEVFLTGGGSLIGGVFQFISEKLGSKGIGVGTISDSESKGDGETWCKWSATGENLVRLATAVGGASVILQAPVEPEEPRAVRPVKLPEPITDYIGCRCQGGNKDCCYCSGKGYYRK